MTRLVVGPGLEDLPDALLHHLMSMLAPADTLRLRAVSRSLAAAARTLPGGLFVQLSIVLSDRFPDTERCGGITWHLYIAVIQGKVRTWACHHELGMSGLGGFLSRFRDIRSACRLAEQL